MNKKRVPLITDEPKYRKKSDAKGLPRSKHKHKYETVLLIRPYYDQVHDKTIICKSPFKVCSICGYIRDIDTNPIYYKININKCLFLEHEEDLSDKALELPKWYANDFWDKFAKPKQI